MLNLVFTLLRNRWSPNYKAYLKAILENQEQSEIDHFIGILESPIIFTGSPGIQNKFGLTEKDSETGWEIDFKSASSSHKNW